MTLDEFRLLLGEICHNMQRTMVAKNKDYASPVDIYQNFREVAEICNILKVDVHTPEGCIMYHIVQKMHRLFKLKREGRTPSNESLKDTVVDLGVYATLLVGHDDRD